MERRHIIVMIILLGLDQLSKYLVALKMSLSESIGVIGDFFEITYVHNFGAAWSILEGKTTFFIIFTTIVIIGLWLFYHNSDKKDIFTRFGLSMMIAGAIGNLVDRIVLHYVRDFLDFNILGYDFPVFNFADISLFLGVVLILFAMSCEYIPVFASFESKIKVRFNHE